MKHIFLSLLLISCATKPVAPQHFSSVKLGTWTVTNELKGDGVILIPQWHLSPLAMPKEGAPTPQEVNQRAIFMQLSSWIPAHTFDAMLAEGCEGSIEPQRDKKYNGWSIQDLQNELSKKKSIDSILAPIAFKVQAQFAKDVNVACGDDEKIIKENQLALSNLRGLAGFKLRIEQSTLSEADRKSYTVSAAEILHLPKNSTREKVIETLNSELKKSIAEFEDAIHRRDMGFIDKAQRTKGIKVIVIGAVHVHDLQAQLVEKNIAFSIWTPVGLEDQDEKLIDDLKAHI